jgi:hypothetical protein
MYSLQLLTYSLQYTFPMYPLIFLGLVQVFTLCMESILANVLAAYLTLFCWIMCPFSSVDEACHALDKNIYVFAKKEKAEYKRIMGMSMQSELTLKKSESIENFMGMFDEKPELTVEKIEVIVEEPEVTIDKIEVTYKEPEVTVDKPEKAVEKPEVTVDKSELTVEKLEEEPEVTVDKLEVTYEEPKSMLVKLHGLDSSLVTLRNESLENLD